MCQYPPPLNCTRRGTNMPDYVSSVRSCAGPVLGLWHCARSMVFPAPLLSVAGCCFGQGLTGFVQPKFQSSCAPWGVARAPWCPAPYRYQKLLLTLPQGPDPVHCVHVERLVSLLFEEPEQFFSMVATYHG